MDGQAQLTVISRIKNEYGADFLDTISEAGMDGYIIKNGPLPENFIRKLDVSCGNTSQSGS